MTKPLADLVSVFGEGLTTTGQVMNLPSGVTKELASQAIEQVDLDPVLRDVGTLLAREIANALDSMALRPADYVDLPDMPQMVAARLAGELAAAPEVFVKALTDQLKLRG